MMATIHWRGGHWRVQVRRRGLPPLSKTFGKHEEATRWAQTVEGRLAVGDVLDPGEARHTTLGEALERYLAEVTPLKSEAGVSSHPTLAARPACRANARFYPVDGDRRLAQSRAAQGLRRFDRV
jgi:hypothetical protein